MMILASDNLPARRPIIMFIKVMVDYLLENIDFLNRYALTICHSKTLKGGFA
jgi:hypothetical protein